MKRAEILTFYDYLIAIDSSRISISGVFSEWIIKTRNVSELDALEIVENEIDKVIALIDADIQLHESKYTFPKFQFAAYDRDILVQTHLHHEEGARKVVLIKIEYWKKLYDLITRLDWRRFELLAKRILKENGLTNITVTQAQNDQGIDFYGFHSFRDTKRMNRFDKDLKFRVVGQVKHSTNNKAVDHQKVASFGTEIQKLRKTNNSNYFQNLSEDFLLSPFPIIGIFITNGYYPPKAINFIDEYGIIYWDGIQIAQDLATEDFIRKIILDSGELSQDLFISRIDRDD